MEFINRFSQAGDEENVLRDLTHDVQGGFDLAILYVCPWQPYDPNRLYDLLKAKVAIKHFICCTCAGIIASQREVEGRPATSLMLARMPGVHIDPFVLNQIELENLKLPQDWYNFFEVFPHEHPTFVAFADPFEFDINRFVKEVDLAYPGAVMTGGLASAGTKAGENILICDGETYAQGVVGIVLTGNVKVQTVVSQGCRPIGKSRVVTKAQGNVIYELGGKPFYKILEDVLNGGTEYDRHLAKEAIFIGIAMDENRQTFKKGDFLIRGVLGLDPDSGAGAVGDHIRVGQTVQFHLRDAKTADEDLQSLLDGYAQLHLPKPSGAFIFSCNGRGVNLFKEPDHEIKIIQNRLGSVPAAGFFCAGEIGPVGGKNFLHGFTNSMALFYPKES